MNPKPYAFSLDQVNLLASAVSQLDHVKNAMPEGSPARVESKRLVIAAHATLCAGLGADEELIYPSLDDEPEETHL